MQENTGYKCKECGIFFNILTGLQEKHQNQSFDRIHYITCASCYSEYLKSLKEEIEDNLEPMKAGNRPDMGKVLNGLVR